MDDSYQLKTPEQVDLAYDVAGLGSRFIAALIDTIIQTCLMLAVILAGMLIIAASGAATSGRLARETATTIGLSILAATIVFTFLILVGYYVFFELLWNGQSPGKRLTGLRVITTGGHPVGFSQVVLRNVVRVVDYLPTSYLLGTIVMLLNKRYQRLGDFAAGTIVVKEYREQTPRAYRDMAERSDLPAAAAAAFTSEEVALARDFLLRAPELDHTRRQELAESIAARLRARVDASRLEVEAAESFLARVAGIRR